MAARDTEPIRIARGTTVSNDLQQLLDNLHVEQIDTNLFRGFTPPGRNPRIYGGQVLAQAMNAADAQRRPRRGACTRSTRISCAPATPRGRSSTRSTRSATGARFSTRRVVARQGGRAIFNTAISYQQPEDGLAHHERCPRCRRRSRSRATSPTTRAWRPRSPRAITRRGTESDRLPPARRTLDRCDPPARPPRFGVWMRANGTMPDDPARACADARLHVRQLPDVDRAAAARRSPTTTRRLQTASLDHGLWFYEDFRADEWLYYHLVSPLRRRRPRLQHRLRLHPRRSPRRDRRAGRADAAGGATRLRSASRPCRRAGIALSCRHPRPGEQRHERSRSPVAHAARCRRGSLLHESRHLGNALRRGAGPRARHALRAGPVRRRGDRRGRRLRAHRAQARGHAAAPGAGARQRPREPAQRPARRRRDRQHRRRSRHLSPAVRHPAHLGRHRRREAHVALGALGAVRRGAASGRRAARSPPRCRRRGRSRR